MPPLQLRPKAHVCPDFFTNLFLFFSYLFFSIVKLSQRMYVQLKTSPKFVHRCVSLCNIKSLITFISLFIFHFRFFFIFHFSSFFSILTSLSLLCPFWRLKWTVGDPQCLYGTMVNHTGP